MSEISEERLREMLAACEGVTLGPWECRHEDEVWSNGGRYVATVGLAAGWQPGTAAVQAGYIANCDPQTIASIITELLARRTAPSQEGAWQPIETAPKDRRIELWVPNERAPGGGFTIVGVWDAEAYSDWDAETDGPVYRGSWTDHTVANWGMEEYCYYDDVTHWKEPTAPPLSPIGKEASDAA